jgi:hypothetical protein
MKATSIVSSVILTLGAVGYLVATEWQFWKKSDGDKISGKVASTAKESDRAAERTMKRVEAEERKRAEAETAAVANPQAEVPAAPRRVGTRIYRTDQICDCVGGPNVILETVEVNDQNTILTILNNQDKDIALYPPGDENAQFLLEWRYVDGNRPRHDLLAVEGIPIYPEMSRPRSLKLIFPRIGDEAERIQLSGRATNKLDYFDFSSIKLDDEIPEGEWRRFEAFKRCGFDGASTMAAEQGKRFAAHEHGDAGNHRWTVTGAAAIVGSATGKEVTIRGERAGKAEVCLSQSRGRDSCRSCQEVEVAAATGAEEPDFFMKRCGGLPSQEPHWQFSVARPVSGATYRWSVPGKDKMLRGSDTTQTLMLRPAPRPGVFEIILHATYASGQNASYTRRFHSVYSCPRPT